MVSSAADVLYSGLQSPCCVHHSRDLSGLSSHVLGGGGLSCFNEVTPRQQYTLNLRVLPNQFVPQLA